MYAVLAVILVIAILMRRRRRSRRYWVHPIVADRRDKGQFWNLYEDLRRHPDKFYNYTRMTVKSFDDLLEEIQADIQYADTSFRSCISPCERLLVTLRYLATGNSYSSLHYEFRLGKSTIQNIVLDTCRKLWIRLKPKYLRFPDKQKWEEVAELFELRCEFPHCLGAIDGKHIRIICPPCSGSKFFNYKKYFSLVLLAVADADYRFLYVDIGSYGSSSDSSIYSNSNFGRLLQSGRLELPAPRPLPKTSSPNVPYFFIGDEAFGLSKHILRPYAQRNLNVKKRNFNMRLSRARRMVECTFGIMAAKWRAFLGPLQMSPENAVIITKAACVLHNFVREKEGVNTDDSETRIPTMQIRNAGPRPNMDSISMRNFFSDYLVKEGRSLR